MRTDVAAPAPKPSIVLVYTGPGKGKTSAGLGAVCRALGHGWRVAWVQFIKTWDVSEDRFLASIGPLYGDKLFIYKGGRGFYRAGPLSAAGVSETEHQAAARRTLAIAADCATSGAYNLVVCDEINNAVHDGLLEVENLRLLITGRHPKTSLCLTGRDFPDQLLAYADIATVMQKMKHHYDDGFLAVKGLDY